MGSKTSCLRQEFLKDIKKVLVIQLGDIGDIVWCIPTLRAIKDCIPGVETGIVVKEGFSSLLESDPVADRVFEIKISRGSLFAQITDQVRFFKKIRARRFDMAIDLRSGDRGAFLAYLSGAKRRITLDYGSHVPFWRNLLFTEIVSRQVQEEKTRGAAEQSLSIVRDFGIDTDDKIPRLTIPDQMIKRAEEIIKEAGLAQNDWITVNPFSRWSYKELPMEKWMDVLDWIDSRYGIKVVFVGAPDERGKAGALINRCKGKVVNLAGKTTLMELAGVLHLSRLHIGVDSAAPHIAAAVGTPTITIYGPSNWEDWAPIGDQHRVIVSDLECVPCRQKGCKGTGRSKCLEELDVEKIEIIIRESLDSVQKRGS